MASHSASRRSVPQDVFVGKFRRLEQIGKGSFATVYRGIHPEDGSLVAVKTIITSSLSGKLKQNLTSEIDILTTVKHPHIVALIQCLESANHVHLVMEFCQLGDVALFVRKKDKLATHPVTAQMMQHYPNPRGFGFNEVIVRHFSKQIASAIEFLHARNLVHRDLKPQNLLLNPPIAWIAQERPENRPYAVVAEHLNPAVGIPSLPTLKIADFGFARHLPTTTLAETLCGSPLYMAPEILRYERYDAKADLWSVGAVLHELIEGHPPFRAANHVDLLRKIEKTGDVIEFDRDLRISDDMKSLIRGLLKKQPRERISFESYFQHPINKDDIPGLVASDRLEKSSSNTTKGKEATMSSVPETKTPTRTKSSDSTAPSAAKTHEPEDVPEMEKNARTPFQRTASAAPTSNPAAALRQVPAAVEAQRPALLAHPTAPVGHVFHPESLKEPTNAEAKINRSPPPASTVPKGSKDSKESKELLERERDQKRRELERERDQELERQHQLHRQQDKLARESRERAAQEVAFERDYVVVEKRAVEVNAFADALAASPQVQGTSQAPLTAGPHNALTRRATTAGMPSSSSGSQRTPTRPQTQLGEGAGSPGGLRIWDARFPPSKISATSAIAAALNTVNLRLTGGPLFPSFGNKGPSPPHPYPPFTSLSPSSPSTHHSLLLTASSSSPRSLSIDEDSRILAHIEERANRADVVWSFAEVKYKQLTPIAPSDNQQAGVLFGMRHKVGISQGEDQGQDVLTLAATIEVGEEALVLYLKALQIIQNDLSLAQRWWTRKLRNDAHYHEQLSRPPHTGENLAVAPPSATSPTNLGRANRVVQWLRERFNDCLAKSEFAQATLINATKKLPPSHPGHISDPSAVNSGSWYGTGVTAEKIMYERALEMNKSAAVNELVGENLEDCELNYETAIHLLRAVLEKDEKNTTKTMKKQGGMEEEGGDLEMEDADRETVDKIIKGTKTRLAALRGKILARATVRRSSLTAANTSSMEGASLGPVPASLPARLAQ